MAKISRTRSGSIGERWIIAGCGLAAIGVAFGALGAHALKDWLPEHFPDDFAKRFDNWETAVRYQMYHALALIMIGLTTVVRSSFRNIAACFMLIGVLLFSGGLFGWVLFDVKPLVHAVPVGGIFLIISWIAFATGFIIRERTGDEDA